MFQHVIVRRDLDWSRYCVFNSEYEPRAVVYLNRLVPNHMAMARAANPDFRDYRLYEKLGCLPYERHLITCANRHAGHEFVVNDLGCRNVEAILGSCIQNHKVMGFVKNSSPDQFAENSYSRDRVNVSEILWLWEESEIFVICKIATSYYILSIWYGHQRNPYPHIYSRKYFIF